MLKRISSLLLTLLIFSSAIINAGMVFAADDEGSFPPEHFYLDMESVETYTKGLGITEAQFADLKNTIYTATRNCAANCSISSFNIKYNQTTGDLLNDLIRKGDPETFHIINDSTGITFTTTGSGASRKFYQLKFNYKYSKQEYDEMRAEMIAAADTLLVGVEGNDSLSDLQKALILHDRLAAYCEYDVENLHANTVPDESYNMYGTMVRRVCVCEGYTKAYSYLLDRAGILNYYCSSRVLKHIWNIVYIDGEKYHIDVTWDDPTYNNAEGFVTHSFFLCSSGKMIENEHNADDFDTTPTSTLYDDAFWDVSSSSFILLGNDIYYIDNEEGTLNCWSGDDITEVLTLTSGWRTATGGIFVGNFSCLTTDGTYVYYSLNNKVMRYDPISGTSSTAYTYTPDASHPFFGIYGIRTEKMTLTVDVNDYPYLDAEAKAENEFTVPCPLPDLPGDVNADGKTTSRDLATMKKYISGNTADIELVFCNTDLNADGKVNSKDLAALKRLIAQG